MARARVDHAHTDLPNLLARMARHGLALRADLLVHDDLGRPDLVLDLAAAFQPVPLAEPDFAALPGVRAAAPDPSRVRFAGSEDPAEAALPYLSPALRAQVSGFALGWAVTSCSPTSTGRSPDHEPSRGYQNRSPHFTIS